MSNETQINMAPPGSGIDHRVTIVERDLKTLGESVTREFADVRKDGDARHLDLKGMIQGLASAQAERSKIQWPAISVVVVLGAAGTLVSTPIKERQVEMTDAIHDRVTRSEFITTLNSIGARRDDAQRTMETRVGRIEGDVDHINGAVVPRGELEAHWADQRDRDGSFQRQLENLATGRTGSRR